MGVTPNKSTTLRNFIFGDFDKDGVANIDDPYPFDKDKSKFPNMRKNPRYYYKARYGDDGGIKFSTVLKKIEKHNNLYSSFLRKVLRENPGSYGRIKSVPSTISKMRKKTGLFLPNEIKGKKKPKTRISDISGVTIETKNRAEATKKNKEIKKRYRHDPSRTKNFYRRPKNKVYYAYHLGLLSRKGRLMELQIKTRKMAKLHAETHMPYKEGQPLQSFIIKARKLYKAGF